jgi:hypothetical protein
VIDKGYIVRGPVSLSVAPGIASAARRLAGQVGAAHELLRGSGQEVGAGTADMIGSRCITGSLEARQIWPIGATV